MSTNMFEVKNACSLEVHRVFYLICNPLIIFHIKLIWNFSFNFLFYSRMWIGILRLAFLLLLSSFTTITIKEYGLYDFYLWEFIEIFFVAL